MKIAIIGAAPTGLGAAYRLNELLSNGELKKEDLEEDYAGGLACTKKDEKGFMWDMGVHITYHDPLNPQKQYYDRALIWAVDDWNSFERNCKVDFNCMWEKPGIELVPYPAQFAVPFFPESTKRLSLAELKACYEKKKREERVPTDFEDWSKMHFGETIYKYFFDPYTKKVWTVTPKEMNATWVGARVPMLEQSRLEELCAMDIEELRQIKEVDLGWGGSATYNCPKYGSIGTIWNGMAKKLPNKWFKFKTRVTSVDPHAKTLQYQHRDSDEVEEFKYDVLISASPLDLLVKHTGIVPELSLQHNKVIVVGVGLKLPMSEVAEDVSWIYFPDLDVPFYRVSIISRHSEVTPDSSKYWSILTETARTPDSTETEEEIAQKTVEGLIKKSLFKREQVVTVYSTTLSYGYPIPTVNRDSEVARAHRALEAVDIYSRGRFGGWKYEYANQDHCFIQGKEVVDRVVFGTPEKLYKTGIDSKQG